MVEDASFKNITTYLQQLDQDRQIPPLEKWNPDHCGKMDLVIKANGEWWHEGSPIRRQKMIDLFSKVLWKEDGYYYLKTPVEKIQIEVEDVPLLITQVDQIDIDGIQHLQMTTQNQDVFLLDDSHPIFMRRFQSTVQSSDLDAQIDEVRPYVRVRYALDALIQRQAFYHLISLGELYDEPNGTCLKLKSGTSHFTLCME